MHRIRYLVGILTLAATLAGAFWIVRLLQQLDERVGVAVQVEFHDARGLRAGADVRYRGVRAGTVREVRIAEDGSKAVVRALLDPEAASQARVNSMFWIVTPRFSGITNGVSGLDTLVRDAYLAFHTPDAPGSALAPGSLVAGSERPPVANGTDTLDEIEYGDLSMYVLLPENHGLRIGSPVTFRGMKTGEVRSVELAADGTHVTARVRILRRHRQTVTDKAVFWVARPQLSGALFSGFTVNDVSALLSPFVSYYGEPGKGVPVEDGHRAVAQAARPAIEPAAVPQEALRHERAAGVAEADGVVVVRIVYAAIERDTFSPDDPVYREGCGVLYLDRAGRTVVVTARSLVDGSYFERDALGTDPDIANEQIKVMLPTGTVLHAGRVWVEPQGADLAALVLTDVPPDLHVTPADHLQFRDEPEGGTALALRRAGPDGAALPASSFADQTPKELTENRGAAVLAGGVVFGIYGQAADDAAVPTVVTLQLLPSDLRPQ